MKFSVREKCNFCGLIFLLFNFSSLNEFEVILRLRSDWKDYYEDWMVPFVDYVPIKDLSDLINQIKLLKVITLDLSLKVNSSID